MNEKNKIDAIKVFFSCTPEDEKFLVELKKHLHPLYQRRLFSFSDHLQILPGMNTLQQREQLLDSASLILLLLSPDYFASHDCYDLEMKQALYLQQAGKAHVLSIILRPVNWQYTELADLPSLPLNTLPITSWSNQDEAFHSIVQSISIEIKRLYPDFAPLLSHSVSEPKHHSLLPQKRYRQKLLTQIHTIWIAGILTNLLMERPFISLEMQAHPDLVENPLQDIVQESMQPVHTLPSGTRIYQVYDDANGELLILGEPGSGKTTLLLDLASTLLERARCDEDHPLPIVLNLSEWARQQKSLQQWLSDELYTKYKISRRIGKTWIDQDQLILLLDGLDEVSQKQQSVCLDAIQNFQRLHPLTSIVLCSRLKEYHDLIQKQPRLQLQSAIVTQPLNLTQIDAYLVSQQHAQTALQTAIHNNGTLRQLAETPLLLSILTRTYSSTDAIPSSFSGEQQTALFEMYVQQMFKRRGRVTEYPEKQIYAYLEELARQMQKQNQTEFYIEQMQPEWLSSPSSHKRYQFIVSRCIDALTLFCIWLVCMFLATLFNFLNSNHKTIFIQQFFTSLGTSIDIMKFLFLCIVILTSILFFAIALGVGKIGFLHAIKVSIFNWWKGLFETKRIELVETIIWPLELLRSRLLLHVFTQVILMIAGGGLMFGVIGFFIGGTVGSEILFKQQCMQLGGQVSEIATGDISDSLTCNPRSNANSQTIRKIQNLRRDAFDTKSAINGGIAGAIFGASYCFAVSPLIGLGMFWWKQVTWRIRDRKSMLSPSKGINLTIYNSIFVGLVSWLTFVVVYGLGSGFILEHFFPIEILIYECIYISTFAGLIFALMTWFRFGGLATIQYLILRLLLSRAHIAPWRYVHFLDFAAERLLLRKVGNGYMFYHQLLLEYFAQRNPHASSHIPD